jgi:hypothetical protein
MKTPTRCRPTTAISRLDTDGTQEALGDRIRRRGDPRSIDKSNQDGINYVDMLRTFYWPSLGIAQNQPTVQTALAG